MYRYWTSTLRITSRFLLSAIVGTLISISSVYHATAGPGGCPARITTNNITFCYKDWLARTGYDPRYRVGVECRDDPEEVETELFVHTTKHFGSTFRVFVDRVGVAVDGQIGDSWKFCYYGGRFTGPEVKRQGCRAAIRRSDPWRELCQPPIWHSPRPLSSYVEECGNLS